MPSWVVVSQLLVVSSIAAVLPPFRPTSTLDNFYTSPPIRYPNRGRKFGGYRIVAKPCKVSPGEKVDIGVCMLNEECARNFGTVVGTCLEGFLYGTCCQLPKGVSVTTLRYVDATRSTEQPTTTFEKTTSFSFATKPHSYHLPEDTILLYKNGSVADKVYRPDDFLYLGKPQNFQLAATPWPITNDIDFVETTEATKQPYHTWYSEQFSSTGFPTTRRNIESANSYLVAANKGQSQSANGFTANPTRVYSNMKVTYRMKPYTYSYDSAPSFTRKPITNNVDTGDSHDNLIRLPTLTADDNNPSGESINHILKILNQTKFSSELDDKTTLAPTITQTTQSLYTWISAQPSWQKTTSATWLTSTAAADKTPSSWSQMTYTDHHWSNHNDVFESVPAVTHSIYNAAKPITKLPSTTLHHILGPSFHVTPEVKITPKPQTPLSESVPTVVVLTSAQHKYGTTESSKLPSKKPIYNLSSSSEKNPSSSKPSFSYDATGGYNVTLYPSTKPLVKKKPASKPIPSILTAVTKQPTSTVTIPIYSNFGHLPISNPSFPSSEFTKIKPASSMGVVQDNYASLSPAPVKSTLTSTYKPNADSAHLISSMVISSSPDATITQTIVVSTAKPVMTSQSRPPIYATSPIGISVTRPISISQEALFAQTDQPNDPMPNYPPYAPDTAGVILNSTDDFVAFPPVRDPNLNLTRIREKPTFTATTLFGDDDVDAQLIPQFVVDKTLDEKVHVFVEKIVQSLQGNFEHLEKVLITGESTNNVTLGTGNVTKKPQNSSKKPTTPVTRPTKKPFPFSTGTTSFSTAQVSKIPSSLATSVSLFLPNPSTEPIGESGTATDLQYSHSSVRPELDYSSIESQPYLVSTVKNPSPQSEARKECGIRPARKSGRIVGGKGSWFGEWPWQVLVREATWLGLFTKNKCGGVLITNKYVITAAHCQPGFLANLVAVFGEFDISGEVETKRSVSKNVRRVIVHRGYDAATFENDIALLELETAVQFDSHIVPICMPDHRDDFTGRMATVTGWGRLKYGGGVPSVLQEVQVPVIENKVCQEMFQTAGHSKTILNSFLCAGYVNGQKDSCEGDSGGPLTIERDGHWTLVATVSHGIKCAAPYLPGVYMRTSYFMPWLQTITGVR